MNEDLFDLPAYKLVRRNDPSTSYEAAKSIDPTKMQKVVLECLRENGPSIYDEVLGWARLEMASSHHHLSAAGSMSFKRKASSSLQAKSARVVVVDNNVNGGLCNERTKD